MTRLKYLLADDLQRSDDCGRPLDPIQEVCIALAYYGGARLTCIAGLCGAVSQMMAWREIWRVTTCLANLKEQVI